MSGELKYLGPLYGSEKKWLLKNTDIFVFPTWLSECFPFVILEAMRAKTAIVSTKVGAIPDIIRDNKEGFLYEPQENVEILAEKINNLVINSELRSRLK